MAQGGPEIKIFLPLPLKYWDYMCTPASFYFNFYVYYTLVISGIYSNKTEYNLYSAVCLRNDILIPNFEPSSVMVDVVTS